MCGVPTDRERRLALNEAAFRIANERMRNWPERRSGQDPHGLPRIEPEEQQMVSDFLRPVGVSGITYTCNGQPCFDGGFTGP